MRGKRKRAAWISRWDAAPGCPDLVAVTFLPGHVRIEILFQSLQLSRIHAAEHDVETGLARDQLT
jgi:hypothetical protein